MNSNTKTYGIIFVTCALVVGLLSWSTTQSISAQDQTLDPGLLSCNGVQVTCANQQAECTTTGTKEDQNVQEGITSLQIEDDEGDALSENGPIEDSSSKSLVDKFLFKSPCISN